jgi:hypothetical protein
MGKTIVIKSDTGRSYDIFIYGNWVSAQFAVVSRLVQK